MSTSQNTTKETTMNISTMTAWLARYERDEAAGTETELDRAVAAMFRAEITARWQATR
jgi:hypothetical protein